ncbi:MAG: hypothetical protein Q9166_002330 [cf. Caloplaca sp. 2 TL-2023]
MGPIIGLTPVPNTDTTVTFTKIAAKAPSKATQADTLVCLTESLAQVYRAMETAGATATPGTLKLSGTQPQNKNCLNLHDMGDGKVLMYGVVAEALQGVALQLNQGTSAAGEFQVWNRQWGYMGWGSIGMGTMAPA